MRIGSFVLAFAGASAPAGRVATALAAAPPCAGVRIQGAPDLAPEWADAVRQLAAQLPQVADSCAAMTLSVEPVPDGGVRLAAMAADGRYTERTLVRPGSLAATALGLVASIPREPATPPADTGARGALPPVQPAPAPSPAPSPAPPPSGSPPRRIELWLGIEGGARIGGPSPIQMLDFEARVDAVVSAWLLSLSLRYAPSIGPDNSDSTYEEIEFGLGAGRRIPLGRGALDVSVVPGLATMNMQWGEDSQAPQTGAGSAFRLGGVARWSVPASDSWRFTVAADADFAPAGVDHTLRLGPSAPTLPVWTAGLRIGAAGALL
jgi:hypothetical protein